MNKDNSKLLILFESNQVANEEKIKEIFNKISSLNKGLRYVIEGACEKLHIQNKYYNCEINLYFHREDEIKDLNCNDFEGIIYILTGEILNTEKIISISKRLKNDSISLFLLAFKDKISMIEEYYNILPLKEFCADNFIEIVSGVLQFDDIDPEDGILRLNDAIQTNYWKNTSSNNLNSNEIKNNFYNMNALSNLPNQNKVDEEKTPQNKPLEKSSNNEHTREEDVEEDFLKLIEKMKGLRNENMNRNLNDEERRKNAEDALMLLTQYMKFEDDEEDSENDEKTKN